MDGKGLVQVTWTSGNFSDDPNLSCQLEIMCFSKDLGLQSLPSPRLLAENPPSLSQGKELTMIILMVLCHTM